MPIMEARHEFEHRNLSTSSGTTCVRDRPTYRDRIDCDRAGTVAAHFASLEAVTWFARFYEEVGLARSHMLSAVACSGARRRTRFRDRGLWRRRMVLPARYIDPVDQRGCRLRHGVRRRLARQSGKTLFRIDASSPVAFAADSCMRWLFYSATLFASAVPSISGWLSRRGRLTSGCTSTAPRMIATPA